MMRNGIVLWIILCGLTAGAAPSFAQEASGGRFLQWRTALSGEERFRYEYRHDFDFNKSAEDTGSGFYQRLRVGLDATLTDEYLEAECGYAHFFSGGYVGDTGADDDVDRVYSQVSFVF